MDIRPLTGGLGAEIMDADIRDSARVQLVFRQGVAYDPGALIESVRGKVGR